MLVKRLIISFDEVKSIPCNDIMLRHCNRNILIVILAVYSASSINEYPGVKLRILEVCKHVCVDVPRFASLPRSSSIIESDSGALENDTTRIFEEGFFRGFLNNPAEDTN